jgi:hypothetical protein
MARLLSLVGLLILGSVLISQSALACHPVTPHFDATRYPADVIMEGVANRIGQAPPRTGQRRGTSYADIQITSVPVGQFPAKSFRLNWYSEDADPCGPKYISVGNGNKIRIFFSNKSNGFQIRGEEASLGLRIIGWESADDNPKSQVSIKHDNGLAFQRQERQKKYHSSFGALSYEDPKNWLKHSDLPGIENWKYGVHVTFEVNLAGRMVSCRSGHIETASKYDKMACSILMKRARFLPPRFDEERRGQYNLFSHEAPSAIVVVENSKEQEALQDRNQAIPGTMTKLLIQIVVSFLNELKQ